MVPIPPEWAPQAPEPDEALPAADRKRELAKTHAPETDAAASSEPAAEPKASRAAARRAPRRITPDEITVGSRLPDDVPITVVRTYRGRDGRLVTMERRLEPGDTFDGE
jgi:hypothetical protein